MTDSSHPFPTVDQVLALPGDWTLVVPEEYADANGHMNIARYMDAHSDGGWAYWAQLGLSEELAHAGGPTTFDVQHHIVYRHEVLAGHEVTVRIRLLDRTDKAVHGLAFLVNLTTGQVANTMEGIGLCVDLATRAVSPFPDDIAANIDAAIEDNRALPWAPPVCGSMALRSRTR